MVDRLFWIANTVLMMALVVFGSIVIAYVAS
jgi:hypothetical protein